MIGQSPLRKEDARLIVGRGRFIDDLRLPGLLHLVLVRSTHARARLVGVDVSRTRSLPGVMAFVAGDLPELVAALPALGADPTNPYVVLDSPRPQPVLARGEVRHVGEAVAAVLATDRSDEDGQPRKQREPGVGLDEGDVGLEVPAPAWRGRRHAQTQERERGLPDAREIRGTKVMPGSFTQYSLKRGGRIEARVDPLGPVRAEFL